MMACAQLASSTPPSTSSSSRSSAGSRPAHRRSQVRLQVGPLRKQVVCDGLRAAGLVHTALHQLIVPLQRWQQACAQTVLGAPPGWAPTQACGL